MSEDNTKKRKRDENKDQQPTVSATKGTTKMTVSGFPWQYMKIHLTTEPPSPLDELHFKNAINHALREAFGVVGAAHHVDILDFRYESQEGIIRTPYDSLPTLRAALTLLREYQSKECRFDVVDCSPYLASIACNSRGWNPR